MADSRGEQQFDLANHVASFIIATIPGANMPDMDELNPFRPKKPLPEASFSILKEAWHLKTEKAGAVKAR